MIKVDIQRLFSERIGGAQFGVNQPIYKFERIKRWKKEAQQMNPAMELIDLGVGEPHCMADQAVVAVLHEEALKPENRFYADNGIAEFKQSAADYMEQQFGVTGLDPETEINHVIGSKSALAMLPAAFINPGDITLMPTPAYPVLGTMTSYYGGEVVHLPLWEENDFLPDLHHIAPDVRKRAKLLYLNYPHNPTGAVANRSFFEQVVRFAQENELIVIHDAAYASLVFDQHALSFLSIPGAKDVGVELHSLSKAFNMTGWRIGFVAGNAKVVGALAAVKDNQDSGQFIPIQKAAAYALAHPEITRQTALQYSRRHELLVNVLQQHGFQAAKPKGSFFQYVRIPRGVVGGPQFQTAEQFSQYLLHDHSIVSVPWDDVGAYVRFSVTYQAHDVAAEQRMMQEINQRLSRVEFMF